MKNDPSLLSFVAAIDKLREDYRVRSGFNYCAAFGARLAEIPGNAKFARVLSTETAKDGTVREQIYAFIVLEDGETKTLGKLTKGDVMKPATYKAPAKHARGNIYAADNGLTTCGSYGPGYLR